jgi:hypothetical protein
MRVARHGARHVQIGHIATETIQVARSVGSILGHRHHRLRRFPCASRGAPRPLPAPDRACRSGRAERQSGIHLVVGGRIGVGAPARRSETASPTRTITMIVRACRSIHPRMAESGYGCANSMTTLMSSGSRSSACANDSGPTRRVTNCSSHDRSALASTCAAR